MKIIPNNVIKFNVAKYEQLKKEKDEMSEYISECLIALDGGNCDWCFEWIETGEVSDRVDIERQFTHDGVQYSLVVYSDIDHEYHYVLNINDKR